MISSKCISCMLLYMIFLGNARGCGDFYVILRFSLYRFLYEHIKPNHSFCIFRSNLVQHNEDLFFHILIPKRLGYGVFFHWADILHKVFEDESPRHGVSGKYYGAIVRIFCLICKEKYKYKKTIVCTYYTYNSLFINNLLNKYYLRFPSFETSPTLTIAISLSRIYLRISKISTATTIAASNASITYIIITHPGVCFTPPFS